jgi:uncharacterized protein involved in outer membrane biogenesis
MRWKWVGLGVVFWVMAIMAAVYAVLASYDYNSLKPRMARMVKDATGRELKLEGQVDLTVGLTPRLVVRKAVLANAPWGSQPQMIQVDTLEAAVRLLPLLAGEVVVTYVGLSGVDVLLETDTNGKGNWEFSADRRSGKRTGKFQSLGIAVDQIRIEDLHLAYRGSRTENEAHYTIDRLDVARQEALDRLAIDLQARYNEIPVALSGQTGGLQALRAHKRFPLELSGTFAGARVETAGAIDDLRTLRGIALKTHVSGTDLAALGIDRALPLPQTSAFDATGLLKGSKASLALEDLTGNISGRGLDLTFSGNVGNLVAFSAVDLKLNGSGQDLSVIGPIIGQNLPTTDQFAFHGYLRGAAKNLSFEEAQASAQRGGLKLGLSGGIDGLFTDKTLNLDVHASGTELAEIGPLVGAALPELGPFDISANLAGSPKAISLSDVSAIVDKSDFKGRVEMAFRKRPKISVHLDSSVIDFSRLMNPIDKNAKKSAGHPSPQRHWLPDDSLPFDVLKKVDADIRIRARDIHARDARLEFGHLILNLENGDFSIDKLEAAYQKTKISGHLAIRDESPPRIALDFLVQGFNLGDFLKETGESDKVQAVVDIAAHGESRGNSLNGLVAHLNGSIGAVMGKGYLSRYLDMLSVNLSQKVLSLWDWVRRHREKADQINCAVVQFDIQEGVATSQAFVFDSQLAVLTGEGVINLGTEQIDFLLVQNTQDPSFGLSPNLRVRGALSDPVVRPDKLSLLTQGSWALSSLAIGPLGLLAPFVHLGAHKAHPCAVPGIGSIENRTAP